MTTKAQSSNSPVVSNAKKVAQALIKTKNAATKISATKSEKPAKNKNKPAAQAKFPGIPNVIHGNGAVAYVMSQVCGGVIGYPITPSTEISEIYEAARAEGTVNVWGKHPFFFSPEGEHSAQSGALGAALTGGQYISNASSSQGILYALESHYVTVGKKVGGFVLQVAARVVSKHSLNVMAGHDDIYALLSSGYTVLFGANPQEAADLAAISYRAAGLSLIPVANTMDGFSTSHMLCEAVMPEPELLKEYIGDPAGRIACPTVAQEMLFGAKGRVNQLKQYVAKNSGEFEPAKQEKLISFLEANAEAVEKDNEGTKLLAQTTEFLPEELHAKWARQWKNAFEKGTRQRVPALVDVTNPGLTGAVQNQPDFQAGAADHRTHFVSEVPRLVRQAMDEYSQLTGREYKPVHTFMCDDADYVMIGLGSVCDDVEAVVPYLRSLGKKVGLVSVKLLQPFPEAEVAAALKGKKGVTVLERSEQTALVNLVTQALYKARENADAGEGSMRFAGIPAIKNLPAVTTAIFGLGGHDLQPRHLIAAFENMVSATGKSQGAPLVYLGSQFFSKNANPVMQSLQARLKAAYPETELMALETGENPNLMPKGAFRIRFHSVGGYGTIASGKLLTDILAGVLNMRSKSAPKYGSEKSGAPTNYYITLSPEPIKITNADLEDVEIVLSPDHKVFSHANPLRGLAQGGTFILQSSNTPEEVWAELPKDARKTLRDKNINFFIIDAFAVAKKHAPTPELQTRMMGIAFIGAIAGHVNYVADFASQTELMEKIRLQIAKKFGAKGAAVTEGNMAVIHDGVSAVQKVAYNDEAFIKIDAIPATIMLKNASVSAGMCQNIGNSSSGGLFDKEYYEEMVARPFRDGTIGEAPILPGTGLFMPAGTAAGKDKGLFRRTVPEFMADVCTGCMECTLACPDAAIPNSAHEIHDLLLTAMRHLDLVAAQREALQGHLYALAEKVREAYRQNKGTDFAALVGQSAKEIAPDQASIQKNFAKLIGILEAFPVAKTRPFFDAMEKNQAGSGGLFSATIDPWKCTGCLECVEVCGPGALVAREQDAAVLSTIQTRFEFLAQTQNTPERFYADAVKPDGEIKRLFLDRANYYATTGGHGGCRGCGEVTAIRMVTSANHALTETRQHEHVRELESVINTLTAKQASISDTARKNRIANTLKTLEKRLYTFESGSSGEGASGMIIANSTGCSSVYASTFPFNCYTDPWVNSLFQDAQPLAKGIFEGVAAQNVPELAALRVAKLELADSYNPEIHDNEMQYLAWNQLDKKELSTLPTVMTIGGDGATYDIGFGALSRILTSDTPMKVLVLNTGVYSNTGGQASTSSFTAQDSDLSRVGKTHSGKGESRKELGIIASFHPNVFVCASNPALQGHFLKNTLEFLNYSDAPAVMDVYTPCQAEHGIADAAANLHGKLAVDSRMNPVFVHDPRLGKSLFETFCLDGNPDPEKTWSTTSIEYVDDAGKTQLMDVPFTPAQFALLETRFKKQFKKLSKEEAENAVAVDQFIDLPENARIGKTPFVYSTDSKNRLVKLGVLSSLIALTEERRRNWQTLQHLAGMPVKAMQADHLAEIQNAISQYNHSENERESTLDTLARAMAELASSSKAPSNVIPISAFNASKSASCAPAQVASGQSAEIVYLDAADQEKCSNCKTCYQELPQIFEKAKMVVNGETREIARMIDGALGKITVTPELSTRIKRVIANCDSEIIR